MIEAVFLAIAGLPSFQVAAPAETTIEFSKPENGDGGLGTQGYSETFSEKTFSSKVNEKSVLFQPQFALPKPENMTEEEWAKLQKEEKDERERQKDKFIPEESYRLADQGGVYVGWLGIVRSASADARTGTTTLTIEHKYFDGLVDTHQMIVSIHGAGDFTATVRQKNAAIPLLSLVRVYGKVAKDKSGGPTVAAEYLRVWDWGLFAFMHYGKDKSNPKWVALRTLPDERSYSARPGDSYYESLLGPRN